MVRKMLGTVLAAVLVGALAAPALGQVPRGEAADRAEAGAVSAGAEEHIAPGRSGAPGESAYVSLTAPRKSYITTNGILTLLGAALAAAVVLAVLAYRDFRRGRRVEGAATLVLAAMPLAAGAVVAISAVNV